MVVIKFISLPKRENLICVAQLKCSCFSEEFCHSLLIIRNETLSTLPCKSTNGVDIDLGQELILWDIISRIDVGAKIIGSYLLLNVYISNHLFHVSVKKNKYNTQNENIWSCYMFDHFLPFKAFMISSPSSSLLTGWLVHTCLTKILCFPDITFTSGGLSTEYQQFWQ